MPEGHTIHRLARDQNATLARQRLTISSPQGRFAEGAKKLSGRKLDRCCSKCIARPEYNLFSHRPKQIG